MHRLRIAFLATVPAIVIVACQASAPPTTPSEPASPSPTAATTSKSEPAATSAKTAPPPAPSAATPCTGSPPFNKCEGDPTPDLIAWLSGVAKKGHRCYDRALATEPKLRGKVNVRVRIGSDGSMCDAKGGSDDSSMQAVADCVAGMFRSGQALPPAPAKGCVDVVVPINFVPRPDDAGAAPPP